MGCKNSIHVKYRHIADAHLPSRSNHRHHQNKGKHHQIVSLPSSTLRSLLLDPTFSDDDGVGDDEAYNSKNDGCDSDLDRGDLEVVEDGSSSSPLSEMNLLNWKLSGKRIRTPTATPSSTPEKIYLWELMHGLEEHSPLYLPSYRHSFSTPTSNLSESDADSENPVPDWMLETDSVITEFDPDVIDTFREALFEKSSLESGGTGTRVDEAVDRDVLTEADAKKRAGVVLYVTSLRGIRRTYEACCEVRLILRGLGVAVDERDVSMHSGFKDELRELLGDDETAARSLPKVFVKGRHVGGVEEVRRLHDSGDLAELFKGLPRVDRHRDEACMGCGDVRFTPCPTCHGCRKLYQGDVDGVFLRCPDCNENGIVRCSLCLLMPVDEEEGNYR